MSVRAKAGTYRSNKLDPRDEEIDRFDFLATTVSRSHHSRPDRDPSKAERQGLPCKRSFFANGAFQFPDRDVVSMRPYRDRAQIFLTSLL
jgi:hypothetical protein